MDRFFQLLADGVHRFEGTVVQFTGDGIMALFGAPIAHEDHAQRACWAALHLRDELRRYADELRVSHGLSFFVRIGLNSGEVIVGKIGDDLRMDYTAQGHVVGLAQRMEQLAEPGCVCLTQHTAALVSGYFTLRDLGELSIKGVRDPLRVHALEGVGTVRTRLERSQARGLSRFVGRVREMESLQVALAHACEGQGQVVGIVGAAGVGKSRLCLEFAAQVRARSIAIQQAHCPPYGKAIPLLPALELLRDVFGITERDAPQAAREKIAGRLVLLDEWFRELLPVVFDFLNVGEATAAALRGDPETRQRQLFAFVRRLVQARSQREPAVILLDDLHWIDPASDAFLAQLVEATAGTRTLLVANFRPEYHADWMQRPSYQQLALQQLGPEAIGELLRDLLGGDPTLGDLAERIRERTGGNPFFIEEVVLGLVEAGHLAGEKGAYRLARAVDAIAIPASVQPVLAARIDRLATREKEVLQAAAVIGKEFSEPVLRHVVGAVREPPLQEQDLTAALHGLTAAEFIHEQELYPVAVYTFKHPLTQEVAYQSQLADRRQRLHAATARAIETLDAQRLDERAALLAHHWEGAGEALTAADWHRRAAQWLVGRDRLAELRHWQRVRDLVGPEPASREHMALGVLARVHMLRNSYWLGQRPEQEVSAVFVEGIALATRLGDPASHAMLHLFYGVASYVAGAMEEGVAAVREGVRWADEADNLLLRFLARMALVSPLALIGHLREAVAVSDEAERLCDGDPELGVQVVGFSPYAMTLAYRGMALLMLGCPQEAAHELERAAEIARARGDQDVLGVTEVFGSMWCDVMGDAIGALNHARRAVEMAETKPTAASTTVGLAVLGRALALNDQCREGAETLERALGAMREYRTALNLEALVVASLAEAYLACGDARRARASADEAVALARTRHTFEVNAHLARARALLGSDGAAAAAEVEAALHDAEAVVERTEARAFAPLIHVERAELARLLGDEAAYQRELREAHRLFTEMGATPHAERVAKELRA
jgi:tetratricopeptide (TPR) repeat protein